MAAFVKRGGLNFRYCGFHKQEYPAGERCPECVKAEAANPLRIEAAKEGLDFCFCGKHRVKYPSGEQCPRCQAEKKEDANA